VKRFAPDQIELFLRVLDEALERSAEITIIGGSALALGYGVASVTNDIDTFESDLGDVAVAAEEARRSTGLEIPIANSTVAQLPEGAELRRRRILEELTTLNVFVLDPHDLAASKLLRGNEHDRIWISTESLNALSDAETSSRVCLLEPAASTRSSSRWRSTTSRSFSCFASLASVVALSNPASSSRVLLAVPRASSRLRATSSRSARSTRSWFDAIACSAAGMSRSSPRSTAGRRRSPRTCTTRDASDTTHNATTTLSTVDIVVHHGAAPPRHAWRFPRGQARACPAA